MPKSKPGVIDDDSEEGKQLWKMFGLKASARAPSAAPRVYYHSAKVGPGISGWIVAWMGEPFAVTRYEAPPWFEVHEKQEISVAFPYPGRVTAVIRLHNGTEYLVPFESRLL